MSKYPLILDAHALMVFLEGEPGSDTVSTLFAEAVNSNRPMLITTVNLGEVLYITQREQGEKALSLVESTVSQLPIQIVNVDILIAKAAARLKSRGGLSYADCFAAALAVSRKGAVITGDPEFKSVEKEVKVIWL